MASLAVQDINLAGVTLNYNACAGGGDQFANDGRTLIYVKNGVGSNINVTIQSQQACNQGVIHNTVVLVQNVSEKTIGPFDPAKYNDANGNVQLTYSAVVNLTIAVGSL